MLVNASDTLERWTNGVVPAGVHRVNVPAAMRGDATSCLEVEETMVPERRSAVLLYRPKGETSVGPTVDFVTPERAAKFEEMTALEYLQQKNEMTFGYDQSKDTDHRQSASTTCLTAN